MTSTPTEKTVAVTLANSTNSVHLMEIIEWTELKSAIIVLSLSIVTGIGLIGGSYFYQDILGKQEMSQRKELMGIENDYNKAKETMELANSFYYRTYQQLVADKFFQKNQTTDLGQQRDAMIKAIADLAKKLKLPQVENAKYKLDEQVAFAVPAIKTVPEFKIYKTQLQLTAGVLHEEDVLNLLYGVESQRLPGLFNIHRCSLKRLHDVGTVKVSQPYLEATCTFVWFTSEIKKD